MSVLLAGSALPCRTQTLANSEQGLLAQSALVPLGLALKPLGLALMPLGSVLMRSESVLTLAGLTPSLEV